MDESGRTVVASAGHFGQSDDKDGRSVDIIYASKDPVLIDLVHDRQFDGTSDDGVILGRVLIGAGSLMALMFCVLIFSPLEAAPQGGVWLRGNRGNGDPEMTASGLRA